MSRRPAVPTATDRFGERATSRSTAASSTATDSERERATVERAVREERAETRRFRLYALGVLVLLYFGLLIVAAFVV